MSVQFLLKFTFGQGWSLFVADIKGITICDVSSVWGFVSSDGLIGKSLV